MDLPTDGKPTSAILASPDLETSNPAPVELPAPGAGSRSWARRRASFLGWTHKLHSVKVARTITLSTVQDGTLHIVRRITGQER